MLLTTNLSQFGGDSSGYSVSGGLHGVGISVVNALSQELHVSVFRRGRQYSQRFSQGVPMTPLIDKPDHDSRVGTRVSFLYDSTIFAKRCALADGQWNNVAFARFNGN